MGGIISFSRIWASLGCVLLVNSTTTLDQIPRYFLQIQRGCTLNCSRQWEESGRETIAVTMSCVLALAMILSVDRDSVLLK